MIVLVASLVGAASGIIGALIGATAARGRNRDEARRQLLEPHLADIAHHAYATVGLSQRAQRVREHGRDPKRWRDQAEEHAVLLRAHRHLVRYAVGEDASDAVQLLGRVPGWTANFDGRREGWEFIEHATALRKAFDEAVFDAYDIGRRKRVRAWRVDRRLRTASQDTSGYWQKFFDAKDGTGDDERLEDEELLQELPAQRKGK